jgi:hypothetical protein
MKQGQFDQVSFWPHLNQLMCTSKCLVRSKPACEHRVNSPLHFIYLVSKKPLVWDLQLKIGTHVYEGCKKKWIRLLICSVRPCGFKLALMQHEAACWYQTQAIQCAWKLLWWFKACLVQRVEQLHLFLPLRATAYNRIIIEQQSSRALGW